MADGDTHARAQMLRLLARADAADEGARVLPEPVAPPPGLDIAAIAAWRERLKSAEEIGAISIRRGKGNQRDAITGIALRDADKLAARVLGVTRAGDKATKAAAAAFAACGDRTELRAVVEEAFARWRRGCAWERLAADPEDAGTAFACAAALLDSSFVARDRRSASMLVGGHSKYLDKKGGLIAAILRRALDLPEEVGAAEIFEKLGILAMGHPICMRVPASTGAAVCDAAPWIGLCPDVVEQLRPTSIPPYLLTVENWASFNRHAREIDDGAAVLFTAGFPSPDVRAALCALAGFWPNTPMFHWGDVDAGGLLIAEVLENAVGRVISPHLMDPSIKSTHWKTSRPLGRLSRIAERGGPWGKLAGFLVSKDARVLEQEALDPVAPMFADGVNDDS